MTNHIKIYGVKPRIQYVANGNLKKYEFPFAIFKTSDVDVYLDDKLLTTSEYEVSVEPNTEGGSISFNIVPANGKVITIARNLSIERTTDFQEGGALRANVLNDELDYQIACQQQIADSLNRSMVLPPYATDTDVDLTLPTPSAGKAIVWNKEGTNLENSSVEINKLEKTLKEYKISTENAATIATEKADRATEQADIVSIKAHEVNSALNQLNNQRSNCITDIPQDIKLELNDGVLTLKSGSKIYVPNGIDTFNEVITVTDVSCTSKNNGQLMIFTTTDGTALVGNIFVSNTTSGEADSFTGTGAHMWYDTTDNIMRYYNSSGNAAGTRSLPIAIVTVSNGIISSIDQIFNGFGYIGSVLFALPGIKGLIPNGRNADGTLKNTSFSVFNVRTTQVSNTTNVRIGINLFQTGLLYYDEVTNYNRLSLPSGATRLLTIIGNVYYSSGRITGVNLKSAFQSIDYKEAVKYTDTEKVTGWGMPDYGKAISISVSTTEYIAPNNGYITFTAIGNNNTAKAFVDGIKVFETNSLYANSNSFPIGKGSVFTRTGGSQISSIVFIPCQGG